MSKTEIYRLDSIEEGIAAMESSKGIMFYFSANTLPPKAKEGDCFDFKNGNFFFNCDETEKRKNEISDLLDSVITKKG